MPLSKNAKYNATQLKIVHKAVIESLINYLTV